MATGFLALTATKIQDSGGNLLASGTLQVTVTDGKDRPMPCSAEGAGLIPAGAAASWTITNGILQSGAQVVDTTQTEPADVFLRLAFLDATGAEYSRIIGVQTTAGQPLNLDTLAPPVLPGQATTVGISVGNVTTGAPGTNATVTNTGTPSSAVLNFTIPTGPTGPAAVVSSNGTNGDFAVPGRVRTNGWATNEVGQIFYFEGSSETRGYTLAESGQLAGGGLAGCFPDLLANHSAWGLGAGTYYNDGCDGHTTGQIISQYTTGNSLFNGVTVPGAHGLSPAQNPGRGTRAILFLDMSPVFNDTNNGISTAQSIANLQSYVNTARADGWFLVLCTCPVSYNSANAAATQQIADVNQAARNGLIPCDLFVDGAKWVPDQTIGQFFNDGLHFSAVGHAAFAANYLAAMIAGGSQTDYSGGYIPHALRLPLGIRGSRPSLPSLPITGSESPGVAQVTMRNTDDTSFNTIELGCTHRWQIGGAGANPAAFPAAANAFYLYDKTYETFRLVMSQSGFLGIGPSSQTVPLAPLDVQAGTLQSTALTYVPTLFVGRRPDNNSSSIAQYYDANNGWTSDVNADGALNIYSVSANGTNVNVGRWLRAGGLKIVTGGLDVTGPTPASSTDTVTAGIPTAAGQIWSDDTYLYRRKSDGTIQQIAWSAKQ